ncbi:MAG: hypothetical protein WEC59_06270 [Salibacteraceae bacterium]
MSQRIDITNYETFAVDYLEGQLTDDLKAEFEAFLMMHPEIAAELEEITKIEPLQPHEAAALDKGKIKLRVIPTKSIDEGNYESLFIASVEGLENSADPDELNQFLNQNPALQQDFKLYQKSVLVPYGDVVFEEKQSLKRPIPIWQHTQTVFYRAAAILVMALGGLLVWNTLNSRIYQPRDSDVAFSSMKSEPKSVLNNSSKATNSIVSDIGLQISNQEKTLLAANTKEKQKLLDLMPMRQSGLKSIANLNVSQREILAYQPMPAEWISDDQQSDRPPKYASAERAEELNLSQLVGKMFLGLDPKKTQTTKDLMRESAKKAAESQNAIAIKNDFENNEKSTMALIAGNFEIKRINYK